MFLAQRIHQIEPSQTLAITALVAELRRSGKNPIDLGAGEPDFDTPGVIKQAAVQAIQDGFTKYTPVSGIFELKEAICDKFKKDAGVQYSPSEILVTCGAKHALANTIMALCEEGDEVIIPTPYWTSYLQQVKFVGSMPVFIETDERTDFKILPYQLQAAITAKTKLLILNSPCNPTGSAYTETELTELAEVIEKHDFFIIYDEIYEKIIYDGLRHVSLASYSELRERVVLINGFSKAYAMTGWRLGYMAANVELIKAATKIQSHTTSNPNSIAQKAGLAALQCNNSIIREMVMAFDQRRKFLADELSGIPLIKCSLPKGAFYIFPNVSEYFGLKYGDKLIKNSIDLCEYILNEAGIAMVPGEAFGSKNHVRVSYANSMSNLQEAVSRLGDALKKLRSGI